MKYRFPAELAIIGLATSILAGFLIWGLLKR